MLEATQVQAILTLYIFLDELDSLDEKDISAASRHVWGGLRDSYHVSMENCGLCADNSLIFWQLKYIPTMPYMLSKYISRFLCS